MLSTTNIAFIYIARTFHLHNSKQYIIITYFINKIFNDIPLRITVTISPYQYICTLLTQLMSSLTIKTSCGECMLDQKGTDARMPKIMPQLVAVRDQNQSAISKLATDGI